MEALDNLNAYKVAWSYLQRLYLVVDNLCAAWCRYSLAPYALEYRLIVSRNNE